MICSCQLEQVVGYFLLQGTARRHAHLENFSKSQGTALRHAQFENFLFQGTARRHAHLEKFFAEHFE